MKAIAGNRVQLNREPAIVSRRRLKRLLTEEELTWVVTLQR